VPHAAASAEIVAQLRQALHLVSLLSARLEPADLTAADAASVVQLTGQVERHLAAVRTLAVPVVAGSGVWREQGARSCAGWLADRMGTAVAQGHRLLDTAKRLANQPEVEAALRAGRLSDTQADLVSEAAQLDPEGVGDGLAAVAAGSSVKELRQRRDEARARSDQGDQQARQRRLHRERSAHRSVGVDGSWQSFARLTPEQGARVDAAWDAHTKAVAAERAAAGAEKEPWGALRADAFERMAMASTTSGRASAPTDAPTDGPGDGVDSDAAQDEPTPKPAAGLRPGPKAVAHVFVDLAALQRGSAEPGERCHVAGLGPIDVSTARSLVGDAIWKLVVTNGVDVASITHLGAPTAAQREAVYARAGGTCETDGCTNTTYLEIDHIRERQWGGPTVLWNLRLQCGCCHRMKTHEDWRLVGPPGRTAWVPLAKLRGDPAKGEPLGDIEHLLPPPRPSRSNRSAEPAAPEAPAAACPRPDEVAGQQRLHPAA